jgi:hypothetical protein
VLDKFPEFDPEWDEARQKAWFSAFERFMALDKGGQP